MTIRFLEWLSESKAYSIHLNRHSGYCRLHERERERERATQWRWKILYVIRDSSNPEENFPGKIVSVIDSGIYFGIGTLEAVTGHMQLELPSL